MKKNYPISIKLNFEELELLNKTLARINNESNFKIKRTDFIRCSLKRICYELNTGTLQNAEILFSSK